MKKVITLACATIVPLLLQAQQTRNGDNVTVSQPVYEDLYLTGGTVTVNAPIYGDLVVAGGTIVLNDTITGDVMAGGGKITINGYVGDDVRAVGGEVYINGLIQGDLAASGGTITAAPNSVVHGSGLIGGGTVVLGGSFDKSLKCAAGSIQFTGVVGQDADCRGSSLLMDGTVRGRSVLAAEKIEIGERAEFYSDVAFWQKSSALEFKNAMKAGNAQYKPTLEIDDSKWQYLGFASVVFMIWYIAAAFVFIVLIQYFFGKVIKKAAEEASTHTASSLGYGFLFLAVIPVAAFVLMFTLIGLPLGLLLLAGYLLILALASVISSIVIANWSNNRSNRSRGLWMTSLIALAVFILLKLLTMIPLLGWLFMLIVVCIALGSIVAYLYKKHCKRTIQAG